MEDGKGREGAGKRGDGERIALGAQEERWERIEDKLLRKRNAAGLL
jgi:hypothetical protein